MTTPRALTAVPAPERVPAGELMRLVAEGLIARGFEVRLPEEEDERRLSVARWGGRCELSVSDFGFVEWECTPWASREPDPDLTSDITTFLLTGDIGNHPSLGNARRLPGMLFKGIVGHELRARGFNVALQVYEDNHLFDVWADIIVTNHAACAYEFIHIADDGSIAWEREYPYEVRAVTKSPKFLEVFADYRSLADSIAATAARAVALSSGNRDWT